ncbi:hypothetical protein GCM10008090_30480 [Arenicella chitinivorans]|uniref:DUF3089 domain-containing protein n=1 Tax=Arenicella chitinivorans TaxID=1329800 RepID=A0A918VRI6_9GAMM|nr:DUF3089 domain-containing protein [Arenicella chitinivorans]GHA18775.1 hypothetical protein GCM10008090_30480 [Arenicella chitinivorans]
MSKKKLALSTVALVTLVFGALVFFHKPLLAWYIEPPKAFVQADIPTPPDYDSLSYWSAHPKTTESADLSPDNADRGALSHAAVDVFFIQPTTLFSGGRWNGSMAKDAYAEQGTEHVMATMASVFSACCDVYAPRYRQAHLSAFLRTGSDAALAALDLAYQDVEAAFDYFISRRPDPGRPFIVASHSQGTLHAVRLLANRIEGQPLQHKLIAAYLIGYWVPPDVFDDTIPSVPLCVMPGQTGCLVTYDTYDRSGTGRDTSGVLPFWLRSGWEWASRNETLCVNPLSWRADTTLVEAGQHLGAVPMRWQNNIPRLVSDQNPGFEYSSLGNAMLEYTSAQCLPSGELMVDPQRDTLFDNRGAGEDRSLHPSDWNLFYMNLRHNARQRIDAFMKGT